MHSCSCTILIIRIIICMNRLKRTHNQWVFFKRECSLNVSKIFYNALSLFLLSPQPFLITRVHVIIKSKANDALPAPSTRWGIIHLNAWTVEWTKYYTTKRLTFVSGKPQRKAHFLDRKLTQKPIHTSLFNKPGPEIFPPPPAHPRG